MGTPPGWSAAAYVATSRNAPVEPEAQSREVSTQGMSKPCESRTGLEPAPPAWEAGMLTVEQYRDRWVRDREYASRAREGQGV